MYQVIIEVSTTFISGRLIYFSCLYKRVNAIRRRYVYIHSYSHHSCIEQNAILNVKQVVYKNMTETRYKKAMQFERNKVVAGNLIRMDQSDSRACMGVGQPTSRHLNAPAGTT